MSKSVPHLEDLAPQLLLRALESGRHGLAMELLRRFPAAVRRSGVVELGKEQAIQITGIERWVVVQCPPGLLHMLRHVVAAWQAEQRMWPLRQGRCAERRPS